MSEPPSKLRRAARAFAWGALILSFPVWGAALLAPFLPLPVEQRVLFAGACLAAGEVLFWGAGLYLGAGVIARFRSSKARN
jgi:membrane protein DedA with SNARE-associated domain